jgi:Icc-related predicted phosphoesterase
MICYFVSDIHGKIDRYEKLFGILEQKPPDILFFGGDLLPHRLKTIENYADFALDYLFPKLSTIKKLLGHNYPSVFLILGNDDPRSEESKFEEAENRHLFHYAKEKVFGVDGLTVFGYPFVPPTPFQLKDWEKYDVSRYADPGCIHPTEGFRTFDPDYDTEYSTIQKDLAKITEGLSMESTICLFHSPPYKTNLDRAALDGKMIEHVPMDVHVGSIAVQKFIEEKQPLITLHGHIHESTRITGHWSEQIGRTFACNASHDGPELSIIVFDTNEPEKAVRTLV